jgi:hypothetical protein
MAFGNVIATPFKVMQKLESSRYSIIMSNISGLISFLVSMEAMLSPHPPQIALKLFFTPISSG